MPHQREQHGGIFQRLAGARPLVHGRGSAQDLVHLQPLQRKRDQPHRTHDRGAPAHPVPHREAPQPAFVDGHLVQLAAHPGNGHGVLAEIEPGARVLKLRLDHPVARLLCAAGFGDHHHQCAPEPALEPAEDAVKAVGIGVIQKMQPHRIGLGAERIGDKLRTERRPADADEQHVGELPAAADAGCEFADVGIRPLDLGAQFRSGCELRGAEPVVAGHAPFVGIRDPACLQLPHLFKGALCVRFHSAEEVVRETHA